MAYKNAIANRSYHLEVKKDVMVEWRKRNIECMQTSRKLKTRKRKKARKVQGKKI